MRHRHTHEEAGPGEQGGRDFESCRGGHGHRGFGRGWGRHGGGCHGEWHFGDFGGFPEGHGHGGGFRGWLARHAMMRRWMALAGGYPHHRQAGKWCFPERGERGRDLFDEEGQQREDGREAHGMRGHGERGFGPFGGGFGPFGRGPGGGRGRGGRRPFEQGDLRWLVLDLIAAQPRHGYEIIKAIEEALDGHYSPSPGVIYPTLTLLEETGMIAGEAQGAKKLYSITEAGREELTTNAAAVEAVRERLQGAREGFGGVPAPEMMRAMGNLRSALQIRLSKGPLSAEEVRAITAAIDRAAGEIERA